MKDNNRIRYIFTWLNAASSKTIPFRREEMAEYFNANVTYTINGIQLCENIDSLFERLKQVIESRQCTRVTFPLKNCVIAGSIAAVAYELTITNNDNLEFKKDIIVIIKMLENKISSWDAVISQKD